MRLFQLYIIPYLKQFKKSILLAILFGLLTVVGASMLTFTSGYLISRAAQRPENILMVYVPVVLVRTFGISRAVTHYIERLIGHDAVLKILSQMRVRLYTILEPQALFIRSRFQTGDLLGTLADDIEHLQDVYIRTILPTFIGLFLFVASIFSLALFDWIFALWITFCLSIIVIVYPIFSLYLLKKRQIEQKKIRSTLYQSLTDAIFGLGDWIISGQKERFITRFSADLQANNKIDKKLRYWNQTRTFQLQMITGLILVSVGVWAGNQAQAGVIAPTYIAAFTLVTLPIIEGLLPLSHAIERIPTYLESMQRLESISRYVPETLSTASETPPISDTANVELKDVYYRYENEQKDAIKKISFFIPHGEHIAVLGKSGAGKSTLIQLLLGAISPSAGSIHINGHEPENYGGHIFEMISVLNQKPYLFATSVKNNIRLGNQSATDEEIENVIKQVRLDKYIHSLPNGLDTQMEETGQRFSGGERQRIALARILLKNTPIVILDEPTVGLDPQTERYLLDTMFTVLKDKTVIWITHHLIGIEKMNQILFIDKGTITMKGSHEDLIKTNNRYRQLYLLDRGHPE
ncbi:thiol reductant ABC exporter subunit CydC [Niallia endozanthoxylica]|uniref:Thiol reductant ABC exporter subunit CydC n=1 Tax=Niallia endozanthoxylica TaxID=2036016 RepID=A0A5J5IAE7_9BACI|nr:thiol reductant ABC exporter subunit CydC [Niallia endozanthoxylica]KAA9031621.1 thiol reductant ABC exporter subunit CydC [Niallia endozanthoxylica]